MMMHLFKVEFAIMMLQGICLKVEFVEFVIQIMMLQRINRFRVSPL
jgi:hypothetical protein